MPYNVYSQCAFDQGVAQAYTLGFNAGYAKAMVEVMEIREQEERERKELDASLSRIEAIVAGWSFGGKKDAGV